MEAKFVTPRKYAEKLHSSQLTSITQELVLQCVILLLMGLLIQ